jgi:hypothetical protein
MLTCAGCRETPCRCEPHRRAAGDLDVFDRFLALRADVVRLSADYVAWLDGDGDDAEPELEPDLRRCIRRLVDEADALGPPWGDAGRSRPDARSH